MFDSTPASFAGVRIVVSEHALEATNERLFPESKNRSARIRKKLIKRFGGEFRKRPCIWKTPHGLVCHPVMYSKLMAKLNEKRPQNGDVSDCNDYRKQQ